MPKTYVITADLTLADRDSDVLVVCNAADLVVNLPKSHIGSKGNRVTVVTMVASSSTGTQINPRTADSLRGSGITASAGKSFINTGATDVVGDLAQFTSDGNGSWYLSAAKIGTWAREA